MVRWRVLRFHSPLIEPDRPFSGIRLSDKISRFRPREGPREVAQADQAQHLVQVLIGESCRPPTLQLVLPPKPLTEPVPRVAVDGSIRGTDGAEAEVVRPSQKHPVQSRHSVFDVRPGPSPAGLIADLPLERSIFFADGLVPM